MIDIDHPAIQVGVGALFGQHPERGGQEREQAVFTVLNAVIESGYLVDPSEDAKNFREARPLVEKALEERQASAPEKVDQGKLPAGSNIIYYCKSCGHITKVNSEDWWRDEDIPPRYCGWCVDHGYAS